MNEAIYHIRVQGKLSPHWEAWFGGLKIVTESEQPPITLITGALPDQAALRGLLNRVWDLNLTVVEVERVGVQVS